MTKGKGFGDYEKFIKPHWTEEELEIFGVVTGFLQTLRAKEFDRLLLDYGRHPYVQHNIGMGDGLAGVVKEGRKAVKQFPDFFIDTKHVYMDGNFVIIHSHMTAKKSHRGNDSKGFNVMDIWKVTEGKIVEHWDAIQPIDFGVRLYALVAGGNVKNANGRF